MKMHLKATFLICCLLAFVTSAEGQKIKVAVPSQSIQQIAFYTSQEQGYYQQEGLDVEVILMTGRVCNLALLGGNVQFSAAAGGALTAAHRGAPLRVVFTTFYAPMHWIYARHEISDVSKLKGKRLAVSSLNGATYFLVRDLLKRHGLDSEGDVLVLGMGVQSTRLGALVSKSADAAILTFPLIFSAEALGFRELVSFLKEDSVQLSGSLVAQNSLLQTNPSMVNKFLKATLKGLKYSRENRDGAKRILARRSKIKEDLAGKIYDLARPGMTADGTISDERQKGAVNLVFNSPEVADSQSWRGFFDFSLIRSIGAKLNAEGWRPLK